MFSTHTFANVGVNYFTTERKRGDGVAFDHLEQYGRESNPQYDTALPLFLRSGHVSNDYLQTWKASSALKERNSHVS